MTTRNHLRNAAAQTSGDTMRFSIHGDFRIMSPLLRLRHQGLHAPLRVGCTKAIATNSSPFDGGGWVGVKTGLRAL